MTTYDKPCAHSRQSDPNGGSPWPCADPSCPENGGVACVLSMRSDGATIEFLARPTNRSARKPGYRWEQSAVLSGPEPFEPVRSA